MYIGSVCIADRFELGLCFIAEFPASSLSSVVVAVGGFTLYLFDQFIVKAPVHALRSN